MELYHKDGNIFNNCLDNLQILCFNCHMQIDNFRVKNIKKKNKHNNIKTRCNDEILFTACKIKLKREKCDISPEVMFNLIYLYSSRIIVHFWQNVQKNEEVVPATGAQIL